MTTLQTQLHQAIEQLTAQQQQQVFEFIITLKNPPQPADPQAALTAHQQVMTQYHELFQRLADA